MTGAFSSEAASVIPWTISMLLTLNAVVYTISFDKIQKEYTEKVKEGTATGSFDTYLKSEMDKQIGYAGSFDGMITEYKGNNPIYMSAEQKAEVPLLYASGAGKTTVLNILGGMDSCSEGEIIVGGKDISKFKDKQLIEYRRHDIGFVFQFYNLVHNLTAKENVELAAQICSNPLDSETALDSVGLLERANNFPAQLSGGEQQRVSIARALAKRPKLLLCDEPTGALDYNTGRQILKLLQETCRKDKMTVVLITHNGAITPMADHIIRMKSGKVVEDIYNENPKNVEEIEW